MRKLGNPVRNELVVCKIIKIFPNSAVAELVQYRKRGLIHVSEVALKWVKDIREFIKLNQFVVCLVLGAEGDDISLSVKRVRREEADRKLNDFKREQKAEKMLELVAKDLKKDLDDAYNEVGHQLQEEFGSLSRAFEFAFKNPELLGSKGIPEKWIEPIIKLAQKTFSEKTFEVKADLNIYCLGPDGIVTIKKVLGKAESAGLEVRYISAPKYMIVGKGRNIKELRQKVRSAAEDIEKEISSKKGTCEFEISESR